MPNTNHTRANIVQGYKMSGKVIHYFKSNGQVQSYT